MSTTAPGGWCDAVAERYDALGAGYQRVRRADPRIAAQIRSAVGDARHVVNVGAGTGSYEPPDIPTVAVEPSAVMIAQRRASAAPVLRARAEDLPFRDDSFDVATAVLTVHHWTSVAAGLSELQRVSRRQVILTWDPTFFADRFWFVRDYLPEADGGKISLGTVGPIVEALGSASAVEPVLVPADCTDGFFAAYWARPEAFLDPQVRAGISAFQLADQDLVDAAVAQLESDLQSGEWETRCGHLRRQNSFDAGYRLVISDPGRSPNKNNPPRMTTSAANSRAPAAT